MEKEIQNLFFEFAWNNKPDKIKRSVLINTQNNGGLKNSTYQIIFSSFETLLYKEDS